MSNQTLTGRLFVATPTSSWGVPHIDIRTQVAEVRLR